MESTAKRTRSDEYVTNPQFTKQMTLIKAHEIPLREGKIFVCQRTDRVIDVWKGLIQHNFISVPVVSFKKGKYYGFLDIADIVRFAVETFGRTKLESYGENILDELDKEEQFRTRTVGDIMVYPLQLRNPFHPVNREYSLFSALEPLGRERGLHRVPIIDDSRKLVGILTQSQVVQYLNQHMEELGTVRAKPLTNFKNRSEEVITVKETDIAMDAFSVMVTKNVTGLAVVNDEGKLVGAISLRDLKGISADGRLVISRLYQNVRTFLDKLKLNTKEPDRPRNVVRVTLNDTFEAVTKTLVEHNIHRVFIVNNLNDRIPIGVVSLKDLLLELIES